MKKIISILLIFMLLLTACSSKEATKTEEELKAEIRAEMEAEDKQKEELKAQLKAEIEAEAKKEEEKQQESIDLKDQGILLDFIYENYDIGIDRNLLKDSMAAIYGDFNNDGIEDVVYYSPDRNGFNKVPFITVKNGKLSLIPSDIGASTIYSHKIEYDGKFIHYTIRGGGTGISATVKELYVYDGEKIISTGAFIQLEGYASAPPDYSTETKGITTFDIDGDYSSFVHEDITTGSEEMYTKQKFVYNPNTYTFTITDISEKKETNNNVYIAENLKPGVKVSKYFKVKDFESGDMGPESIKFTLEGNDFVSGTLSSKNEVDFYFSFDEPIIDKNILVRDTSNPDGVSEVNVNENFNFYNISTYGLDINEDILVYVSKGGELKAKGRVKEISYEENAVESMRKAVITEFIIDDSELEKVNAMMNSKKLDFESETLYSLDKEVYIDYSKYELVIVPMQNTINEMGTKPKEVVFSEENATKCLVTILGQLDDVKLSYTPNAMDNTIKSVEKNIGTIKDTRLYIDAFMATDFASVTLTGTFVDSDKNKHEIGVSLDDCRDPESYEIIMK